MKHLSLLERPRRNRKSAAFRGFAQECELNVRNLLWPVFLHEASEDVDIASMPGQQRLSLDSLWRAADRAAELKIPGLVLFPSIPEEQKTAGAEECFNPDGLIPRVIRKLKEQHPELLVVTDVALDPYSSQGHDGLVDDQGRILNDESVAVLVKQALCQAEAGADIVAPSDMMDGRIGALRTALDDGGYTDVSLLSYTAKYASSFYGPFRDALDSAPKFGDKKTYQMDVHNAREALRELSLDESEGADMVMVKPAGPYLDVIRALRENTTLPIAAYQVSGEYAMLKAAAQNGWLDEKATVLESLISIRRAGADIILTYFAPDVATWLA